MDTPTRTRRAGSERRMRLRIVLASVVVALGGSCASPAPPKSDMNSGVCDASKVQWAIGMSGDQATMGRIWRESGAGLFRPLIEGQTPRRDYKPDRVNIHLDGSNRIVAIDCG